MGGGVITTSKWDLVYKIITDVLNCTMTRTMEDEGGGGS